MDELEIRSAYDGTSVAFRVLSAFGWGELVNLGYYPWWAIPGTVFGLAPYQRRLARRALALLDARPGERVLDAACGRGYTTAELARSGAQALGLDLLLANVEQARERFASVPGAQFAVGDVTRLPARAGEFELADASFDRVLCLEAAFHFGAKGRRAFLAEAFRVLRPGGRLVLVDFAWRDDRPEAIESLDPRRLVRDTWRFGELEPLERYRTTAQALGFRELHFADWTRPVIDRFQWICMLSARVHCWRAGRVALGVFRPGTERIPERDWRFIVELMRAHDTVRTRAMYVALVLERPADA